MKPEEAIKLEKVRNHLAMVLATNAYLNVCKSTDLIVAIDAIDKQIPKKLVRGMDRDMVCPSCSAFMGWDNQATDSFYQIKHCDECGQAIDWGVKA